MSTPVNQPGLDHPDTLTFEHNLAVLLGHSEEAEKLYRHVVQGRKKRLGKEHPDTLRSVSNLACLLEYKGDVQTALDMQNSAYKGLQKRLGEDHPDTLTCMNNLAARLITLQHFKEAEPLCRRALKNREKNLGRDHRDTLTSVNNLAYLLKAKKMYADAEYYYRRALEGFMHTLGPDHQDTLQTVYSLATLLEAMGRYKEAEPLTRQALEGFRSKLGADHPDTLRSVLHFAAMLQAKHQHKEALGLCREVMGRFKKDFGIDHPDTITAEDYLAGTLEAEGQVDEALKSRRKVLEARERVLGPDHWDTLSSLDTLAALLLATGSLKEAEQMQRRALELRVQKLGADHHETLKSARVLASYLKAEGGTMQLVEAHALLQEAKTSQQQLLGLDHQETITCTHMLASVLASLGELDKAEYEYAQVLELLSRTAGPEHSETLEVMQDLAALKEAVALEGGKGSSTELESAEKLASQAVDKRRDNKAAKKSLLQDGRSQLACVKVLRGDDTEAQTIMGGVLKHDATLTKDVRHEAAAQEALGNQDKAVELLRTIPDEKPYEIKKRCDVAGGLLLQSSPEAEDEAESLYTQAVEKLYLTSRIRMTEVNEINNDSLQALDGLSRLMESRGAYGESETLLQRRLAECYDTFGTDHPETYENMHRLARAKGHPANKKQDVQEAARLLKKEMQGVEKANGTQYQEDSMLIQKRLDKLTSQRPRAS
ncbi:unnamed protein product [Effrenium voratum]|nr:unnamed protein product [Effrenium voratum]